VKPLRVRRLSEAFISLFVALILIIIQFLICEFFGRFIIRVAKIMPRSAASSLCRHGIYFNLIHTKICCFFLFGEVFLHFFLKAFRDGSMFEIFAFLPKLGRFVVSCRRFGTKYLFNRYVTSSRRRVLLELPDVLR